uniref:Uncharacterized protein n=1 Tax=Leersia perrieri TaxID=77586 RepID=A0A0D9Y0R2_9ORYZ
MGLIRCPNRPIKVGPRYTAALTPSRRKNPFARSELGSETLAANPHTKRREREERNHGVGGGGGGEAQGVLGLAGQRRGEVGAQLQVDEGWWTVCCIHLRDAQLR